MSVNIAVDLRERFGLVRDQGPRPTCLAFSISDTHASLREGWTPLSVEYIFYHAQQRSGGGLDEGCKVSSVLQALEIEGQPVEAEWPYADNPPRPWSPPTGNFETFRRSGEVALTAFESALTILDGGNPVVLLLQLSRCFFTAAPNEIIRDDAADPPNPAQQHAVVALAHGEMPGEERLILVRNSWGEHWATEGHAWLSESFLKQRLIGHVTLEQN